MTLDDLESDRSDRRCNVLLPAFWLAILFGGVVAMVVWAMMDLCGL